MRIGIDARMMGKKQATGIGSYIYNLVARLPKDSTDEFVIFVSPKSSESLPVLPTNSKVIVSKAHWYSFAEQTTFLFQLYRSKCDLIHFPQFNVPLLYFKPYIVTIHDLIQKHYRIEKHNPLKELMFSWVFSHAINSAKAIITVSEHTKKQLLLEYPKLSESKVKVTYLGVDNFFESKPNYDKIEEVKTHLNIAKPYLLFLGVHRPHKNLVNLIKAFEIVKQNHDLQLVIGGTQDPRYTQETETLNALPSQVRADIITPGFIPQEYVAALYSGARAYTVVSFEEGFGLNGLESMQAGVPVVASNSTCLQEIYGDAAHYCDPHSITDIAQALEKVITDKAYSENLITRGHTQVAKYDWNHTSEQTLDSYKQQLGS